jgi:hypothetical protein
MGIKWEYEPQGYELHWRLSMCPDSGECSQPTSQSYGDQIYFECGHTISYLPDFWLPDLGLFAEVKGSMDEVELLRTINAIAAMGGNYHDGRPQNDFLLLGPMPDDPSVRPYRLHMHKGTLYRGAWTLPGESPCDIGTPLAYDVGGDWASISEISDFQAWRTPPFAIRYLLRGIETDAPDAKFTRAYRAARSARFEHGQSGAQLF